MAQEEDSGRALWSAVYEGDVDRLKEVLSNGVNPNIKVSDDTPLLLCAATYNKVEIIRYLLENANVPIETHDKYGRTALLTAASSGNLETVQYLVSAGANLLARTALDETALHLSARTDSLETFKFLQQSGIPVDALDIRGRTVLHHAAECAKHLNIVEFILQGGWLPVDCQDKNGQTPLMLTSDYPRSERDHVCWTDITKGWENPEVKALLNAGAESSCYGKDFLTKCLHIVVWEKDFELTSRMLAEGADINGRHSSRYPDPPTTEKGHTVFCLGCWGLSLPVYTDPSGYPPLFEAIRCEKMFQFLTDAGADVNFKDDHGWSPLHKAFHDGNLKVVDMLLDVGADPTSVDDCCVSLLHMFSRRPLNHKEVPKLIQRFIEGGVRVNAADHNGRTPLHYAANEGNWKYLKILIDAGGDVNSVDVNGATPFHMIAHRCFTQTARILIDAGANITASYPDGQKIIHHASQLGDTTAIDFLIDIWPEAWGCDNNGNTVLHYATRSGNNIRRTIEHIVRRKLVSVDEKNDEGQTALALLVEKGSYWKSVQHEVEVLLAEGASPSATDNKGKTPLHIASGVHDVKVMEVLIAAGAEVTAKDVTGQTPLHWAAKAHSVGALKLLLQKGANIDEQDSDGKTPLMLAVGSSDAVNTLLKNGASISVRDYSGKTALQEATHHGTHHTVKLLWTAGSSFMDIPQESRIRAAHLAVTAGDEEILDHLISLGMSLPECWWDPQHNTTLLHCAVQSSVKMVKKLIDSGHSEYVHDDKGHTPFHLAVLLKNYVVTKYLVEEAHVPVDERDLDDRTALMLTVSSEWWYPEVYDMLEILVNAGADISAQDKDGKTAYQLAHIPWSDRTHDLLDYMQHRL